MSELGREHRDPSTTGSDADSASAEPFGSPIQRKVLERRAIQRRKAEAGQAAQAAGEGAPAAGPSGEGKPLPAPVREKMERAFGADFSDVRVHEGPKAAAIGAVAYTQGSDIYFAPGQYQPGSAKGDELLGHELAHVVQQRAGRVATPQAKGAPINADAGLESEADTLGAKAAAGHEVQVAGATSGAQRKSAGAPIQRLYDAKYLQGRALDVYGGCLCGDTGLLDKWMGMMGEAYVYDAQDWKHFLAALDDGKRAVIRKFFNGDLSKIWVTSTIDNLRKVLPPELAVERKPAPKPLEGLAPGMPEKDALNVVYQGGSERATLAATHVLDQKFEKAAMALEGPAIGKDDKARRAFIEVFNQEQNQAIDRYNEMTAALDEHGLGSKSKPLAHVAYQVDDPLAIDKILDERFGGKERSGYLKQLVADGKSSPLWRAKLALGVVQSAWSASEEEVFHIIVDAPPQLAQFQLTWPQFWDPIKDKVRARIKHWNHSSMYNRLLAFTNVQLAEGELEEARKDGKKELFEAGRAVRRARKAKKDTKALEKTQKKTKERVEHAIETKEHASQERQIEHLVTLIRNTREELNEFDQEAIAEVREWAQENAAIRVRAAADPRIVKALKDIKKPRNRTFLTSVIAGDSDGKRAQDLQKRGFDDAEHHVDEVLAAEAVVAREKEKHDLKKGKHHTNLKATLMSMSHAAREQYLARVAQMSKEDLEKPTRRQLALIDLATELEAVGLKGKEAEELVALFRLEEVGDNYAKLRALVMSNLAWRTEKFGDKAMRLVIALKGGEYAQTRSDEFVIGALRVCTKAKEIEQVLGSFDAVAKVDEESGTKARDDAELNPKHWALLLTAELDKTRVPLPKVARQHRNKVHMIAYEAQVAGDRKEQQAKAKGKSAPASELIKAVHAEMGHKTYFGMFYPTLSKTMAAGGRVTLEHVLDEVLFHDGPLRLGGHGGPAFYTHVNQEDFLKTALMCEGQQLLTEWSNIEDFRSGLKEAQSRDAGVKPHGGDQDAEPPDAMQNERAFRHQFVLDVRADRKKLIKKAVGNAAAPEVQKKIRERMSEAAASDPEFKGALDTEGINSLYHRDRINLRSSLEAAQKRRRGVQLHGTSSKGIVDSQNQRALVGGLRRADRDLQSVPLVTQVGQEDDSARTADQDHLYKEKHQDEIAHDDEALKRSGAEFDKLRQKIRKYTELAITIAVMVIATAIAAGITAATWGGGSPTLVGVALLWAKFGVMIAAKLTAVAVTALLKQGTARAITGDEFDGRALATDIAVGSVGAIAGGATGTGVGEAIEAAHQFTSVAAIEVLKVLASAGAKAVAKQGVKGLVEQRRGDVTFWNSVQALVNTELSSIPAGEIAAAIQLEQDSHDAKHNEELATDKLHEQHDHLGAHEGQHSGESNSQQVEHVHASGIENLHEGGDSLDSASTHLDGSGAGADEAIVAAHTQIAEAHQALSGDPPNYEAAQEHITEAQTDLDSAREHFPDGSEGQAHIDEAQAKLDEAHDQIGEAKEKLETAENFEHTEKVAEEAELRSAKLGVIGQPMDWTVEQLLDFALDKVEDVAMERIKERAERRKEKMERAKEKLEGGKEEAHAEPPTPHSPGTSPAHAHGPSPAHAQTPAKKPATAPVQSPSKVAAKASAKAPAKSPPQASAQPQAQPKPGLVNGHGNIVVTQELIDRYLDDIETTHAYLNEAEGTVLANLLHLKVQVFREAKAPANRGKAEYIDRNSGKLYRECGVKTKGGGDCLIHGLSVISEGENASPKRIASARLAIADELGKAENEDLTKRACEVLVNAYLHQDDHAGMGEGVTRLLASDPSVQAQARELRRRAAEQARGGGTKDSGGSKEAPSKGKASGPPKPRTPADEAMELHPEAGTMFPNLTMGDGAEQEACLLNIGGHYIVVVPVKG